MKLFTAEERKRFILDYVRENEFADISFLKDALLVSDMTVRRDLKKLEKDHGLVRVMGGARSIPAGAVENPVDKRAKFHSREKDKLARYAAAYVCEGDSIFMDASSTVYGMTNYLNVRATVITNSISICLKLKEREGLDVILIGGALRKPAMSLVGMEAARMLEGFYVDKAFLSSEAVDVDYGISDAAREEADVKRAMMKSSREVYFLMDHHKLGARSFCKVCDIRQVTGLLVDASEDQAAVRFMGRCADRRNIQCVH